MGLVFASDDLIHTLEELCASPEILWNQPLTGLERITFEQNPHFCYLRFLADQSVYTPMFQLHPLRVLAEKLSTTTLSMFSSMSVS